jgi:hypothetical protein
MTIDDISMLMLWAASHILMTLPFISVHDQISFGGIRILSVSDSL